ncbi:DUF1289 domain-containing protein [Panacagrimonas sp.]|uniref:DUF1289 domain-containing protein n=1 Tax=Panacagrimonas sp. TaxID=2480088 RepID=UPI003B52EEA6
MESPCIGICQLDASSMCIGCGRLMSEIVEWPRVSEARRREIRRQAQTRMPMSGAPDQP